MGAIKPIALLLLVSFILLNVLAYRHAGHFFHYVENARRPPPPEQMTWTQRAVMLVAGIPLPKPRAHDAPDHHGMDYSRLTIPGRDHIPLGAWRIPAGPSDTTVILFHGYNSEKSGLLPEARRFHDMGYHVIAVDFPGAGESPGNTVSLGIHEARDVAEVVKFVRRENPAQRVVVYGHSMGGAAVLRALAREKTRPDAAVVESVFDSLLSAIRFRFRLMSVPASPGAELLLFWGSVRLRVNGFAHNPVTFAAEVDTPVMVIHGKRDDRASWAGAERVFQRLRGNKHRLLLENAGHVNPSASDPERWSREVKTFIEESRAPSRSNIPTGK